MCILFLADQVYCPTETFSPTCSRDEIVIIDFAYYGRMRMSRCVKVDFGYIGCYDDVTREADLRCSGKHECEIRIPDAAFNDAESCMGDLVRYFEGSHHCQPGKHGDVIAPKAFRTISPLWLESTIGGFPWQRANNAELFACCSSEQAVVQSVRVIVDLERCNAHVTSAPWLWVLRLTTAYETVYIMLS